MKAKGLKAISIVSVLAVLCILILFGIGQSGQQNNQTQKNNQTQQNNETQQNKTEISLRFVVMADCRGAAGGINGPVIEKTLEGIKKLSPQPAFAVMPGDLVNPKKTYSDTKDELAELKSVITKYYPIDFFYPGLGNHDVNAGEKGEQAFGEVFSEFSANFLDGYNRTIYYFDKSNFRFYILNTNHPGEDHMVSDAQLDWIRANTDSGKTRNFYFFHEPAYPTGANIGSSLDVNRLQRSKLWQVIDSSINPMVFCGHEHNYTRRQVGS